MAIISGTISTQGNNTIYTPPAGEQVIINGYSIVAGAGTQTTFQIADSTGMTYMAPLLADSSAFNEGDDTSGAAVSGTGNPFSLPRGASLIIVLGSAVSCTYSVDISLD